MRQARATGYRSRAAYKLAEIDRRDALLRPGMTVLDLGAAPGAWSQYAAERLAGRGRVIAVDVLPMAGLQGVECIEADVRDARLVTTLREALGGQRADLVISDMSPNITGVAATDEARFEELLEALLTLCDRFLATGGTLLVKLFTGAAARRFRERCAACFREVATRKPSASRAASKEFYILARGFRGAAR